MRRPAAALALCGVAVVISSCGNAEITGNTDKKPSKAALALLAKGPNTSCSASAPAAERKAFIADHPELTNDQLSIVCPELFPKDYKPDKKYDKYRAPAEAPATKTTATPPATTAPAPTKTTAAPTKTATTG